MMDESGMNEEYHLTEMTIKGKPVQIYDNFLETKLFKHVQKILLGPMFPWVYNDKVIDDYEYIKKTKKYNEIKQLDNVDVVRHQDDDTFQFTHLFFRGPLQGDWSPETININPVLNAIAPRAWTRIKANLGTKDSEHMIGGWHCDLHWPEEGDTRIPYDDTLTAILYMNTNNGYTLLETGYKVESVENRLVIFPNNVLHTGISQTDTNVRVLINFDFWL